MEIITEWPILTEELKKVILRGKNPEEYEIYPVAFRRKPTDIGYVADKQLLDEFKKDIKSEHPIKDIYVKNRQDIDFQCRFSISSKKMANQLNKLGIMPAKTFKIDFPILDSNLIRHFIRGYFDGDGCIYNIKNSKSSSITIFSASENFKDYLVEYFINVIGFKITTYKKVGGYALCFYKKEFIEKFYKFLYDDANIYLERKRIKFPNILE